MSKEDLSKNLELDTQDIERLFVGDLLIDEAMALKLKKVLGPSQQFWINLEANYRKEKENLA